MDEKTKTAFDFARDTTKQLLTLSTGIIALTITFSKHFVQPMPEEADAKKFLVYAWCVYLSSILFGIWTMMALTGTLEAKDPSVHVSIRGKNVIIPSILQIATFSIGTILTVIFGIKSI